MAVVAVLLEPSFEFKDALLHLVEGFPAALRAAPVESVELHPVHGLPPVRRAARRSLVNSILASIHSSFIAMK